jgi:Kef-type K+ transport system membrane component KefB
MGRFPDTLHMPPDAHRQTIQDPPGRRSLGSIVMASIVGLAILASLSLLSFGFAAVVFAIVLVVFGIVGMHYFVWGWWLSSLLGDDTEQERQRR